MAALTQAGLLLTPEVPPVSKVMVPQPSADLRSLDLENYRPLLPDANPSSLRHLVVPFSTLTGQPVVVILSSLAQDGKRHDTLSQEATEQPGYNGLATRLTASLTTGLGTPAFGAALAFYAEPGKDLGLDDLVELDNCISEDFIGIFEEGRTPSEAELQQLVEDFQRGDFRTTKDGLDLGCLEEEGFGMAAMHKEYGNEMFKQRRYREAVGPYRQGIKACSAQQEKGKRTVALKDWVALEVDLHNNLAMALLKLAEEGGPHEGAATAEEARQQAEAACTAALELQPGNAKSLYRRARAKFELGRVQEAAADLQQITGPSNPSVEALRQQVAEVLGR